MAILSSQDYTEDQEVRDAIATLLDRLPEGPGLGFFRSRIDATEQSCLVVLAFDPRDIADVVEKLGIAEGA